jgi:hypothetical protein
MGGKLKAFGREWLLGAIFGVGAQWIHVLL